MNNDNRYFIVKKKKDGGFSFESEGFDEVEIIGVCEFLRVQALERMRNKTQGREKSVVQGGDAFP